MCEIFSIDGQRIRFEPNVCASSTFIQHLLENDGNHNSTDKKSVHLVDQSCTGTALNRIRRFLNGETAEIRFWFENIANQSEKIQFIGCANFLDIHNIIAFVAGCKNSMRACVTEGRADLVRTLIELKANPQEQGFYGKNVESMTKDSDCIREICRFLKLSEHWTDVMMAAYEGDTNQVERHLSHNGHIASYLDSQNKEGKTALHYASEMGHVEVVHLLLHKKADVHAEVANTKKTSLHFAAFPGHFKIMDALLDAGADVNARIVDNKYWHYSSIESSQSTALYIAAKQGHARAVQLLLERKASVNHLYKVTLSSQHFESVFNCTLKLLFRMGAQSSLHFTRQQMRGTA
jgi:hypothetical protein